MTDNEKLEAQQLLEMSPEQWDVYIDDGEYCPNDLDVLWKYAKEKDAEIAALTAQLSREKRAVERLINFDAYCHEGLNKHCTDKDCKDCMRDYAYLPDPAPEGEKGGE